MEAFCDRIHASPGLECYTYIAAPVCYIALEVLCILCTIKSCSVMWDICKSHMLILLYSALNLVLLSRLVALAGAMFVTHQNDIVDCVQIVEMYSKDVLILAVIGRTFEIVSEIFTRYSSRYLLWKSVVWATVLVHSLCFLAMNLLRAAFGYREELVIYEICLMGFVEAICIYTSVTYISAFKKSLPDAYDTMKVWMVLLFLMLNVMMVYRIFFQIAFSDDILEPRSKEFLSLLFYTLYLVLTEIVPFSILLLYLTREFKNKDINIMAIGSFVTIEDIIDRSEYSEAASHI
ncbi:MAG: hypothetical protein P4L67_03555 [Candidatus Pacebacteria bacterium]|nr:hypothetical protein [Candidatus Paceibacterota bacterium]